MQWYEIIIEYTPNISELISFAWFQYVCYLYPVELQSQKVGRWCGATNNIGSGNNYYIIKIYEKMITRPTVAHTSNEDNATEVMR